MKIEAATMFKQIPCGHQPLLPWLPEVAPRDEKKSWHSVVAGGACRRAARACRARASALCSPAIRSILPRSRRSENVL
jgi:hypothetical protein